MISDSCSCCGTNAQGCKAASRMTSMTWCSICDHGKSRRKCHSEGMYQESDPLKELNRCCDKGCDYIHSIHSSHHSQIKRSDIESEEKKLCSDNIEMEVGDVYHGVKKHYIKPHKDKFFNVQRNCSSGYHGYHTDMSLNSGLPNTYENSRKLNVGVYHRTKDINVDKINSNLSKHENMRSNLGKYHCIGDSPDIELPSNKPLSYLEQDKYSSEMRERYIREMEILKSKLNLLKGEMACDGKRLRQRSESEPSFPGVAGNVPKRARDISPKFKYECRKLPASPPVNQICNKLLCRQIASCKESKSDLPCKQSCPTNKVLLKYTKSDSANYQRGSIEAKFKEDFLDPDNEGSICDEEYPSHEDGDVNVSEDDDHSILSNTTSGSNDSNTPSQVGETLGSITLNEAPRQESTSKNVSQNEPANVELPKPVPMQSLDYLEKNDDLGECSNPFRISLFSNVPPYVKFFMHDFKGPTLPADITRNLKWKLSSITPIIIRRTLTNSGFKLVRRSFEQFYGFIYIPPHRTEESKSLRPCRSRTKRKTVKESNDWTGQWGKHMKSFVFKTLKDFQKLNHFPGTFQIGRKDKLWKNLFRLIVKFGKKEFGFIPKTYILPQDSKSLRTAWEKASGSGKGQWIVKPPAAARGTGIKVIHKWGQIPKKRPLIVQKYIAKPYLINGSKFDLRLYVLMTSIHPLRIYLYDDGLVRFASVKYSEDIEFLNDRFMHLTNYSINKLSTQYCANEDASSCRGHKWTLKALWTYLTEQGVNVKLLRKNLIDLVIKTIISGESNINILSKNNLPSRYCSYELFGIDVLLDHTLKPWLLEVNISPSLHSASPLDLAVKGPLVRELLNIAGFQIPGKLAKEQEESFLESYGLKDKTHSLCYDKRIYWTGLSKEERLKQETHHSMSRDEYLNSILEDLTPDDIRHLIQFEDELTQLARFEKVFPTPKTYTYHQFFESPRYYNMMLDAWETRYNNNREDGIKLLESLCQQKLHLVISFPGSRVKPCPSQSDLGSQLPQEGKTEGDSDVEKQAGESCKEEKEGPKHSPQRGGGTGTGTASAASSAAGEGKKVKCRGSGRPSIVSKPVARTSFPLDRRLKARLSPRPVPDREGRKEPTSAGKSESIDIDYSFKLLAEMQESSVKALGEAKQPEALKQYPSCKLENSIIGEGLGNGKSVLSPPKHIHNTCIKMNISS